MAFACTVGVRVPERVYGKESLLRQALSPLAENAVKFTDSGAVAISATLLPHAGPRSCRILFAIEESGCGIPDEKLLDVFQPFTQVDDSYIRTSPGLAAKAPLPIVGLSSAPAKRQKAPTRERGLDAVVSKPLDVSVLVDTIKTLMARP